jgi:putative tricarboxylic transport membrane protein
MINKDLISSGAAFLIGLIISLGGYHLDIGSLKDPGSGFIFFGLGLIVIGLSVIVFLCAMGNSSVDQSVKAMLKGGDLKQVGIVVAAIVFYAATFKPFGFLISTLIVMFFLFKLMGSQSWKVAIIGAMLSSFSAYLVFDVWLRCSLPAGLLPFG